MDVKRLAKILFRTAIVFDLMFPLRFWYRRKLCILFYHGVSGQPESQPRHDDGRHVRLEKFRRQMEYVSRKYRVLSLETVMDALASGAKLPPNALVITFDDGYRNNLDDMFPVVKALGLPVTIFITTDFAAGNHAYLNWDDVRSLRRQGVSIGSHTVTHAHLTGVPADQALAQLNQSKRELENRLGEPVRFFSYPYGEYNAQVRDLVERAGYEAACTVRYGVNDALTDRFLLKRVAVNDNYSFEYFVAALFPGLFSVVRGLLRPKKQGNV